MNAILQISRYIYKNNPWYHYPWRIFMALFYQCHKRIVKTNRIKTLFNGKKMFLFPGNPISSAFIYSAIPDKAEIFALRELADANTIFLDVGANIGAYSLQLLDKVKAVYAFEAHPLTADCCKKNFALNQVDESHVLTMAVSNDDKPKLFSNMTAGCPTNAVVKSKENAITVPAITLDAFVKQQEFDSKSSFLLKVDVEGYEHEVFAGAGEFLKHYWVKGIIFETFSSQNQAIIERLHELGFQTRKIGDNNMLAIRVDNEN